MTRNQHCHTKCTTLARTSGLAAALLLLAVSGTLAAQQIAAASIGSPSAVGTSATPVLMSSSSATGDGLEALSSPGNAALPDAPLPETAAQSSTSSQRPETQRTARTAAKFIPAGWRAQPLNARGKMIAGASDLISIDNFAAMFLSAGYEQLLNGQPNYGTDKGAFGARLGAAAIRETSQGMFTDMVFAPLLHEDPRYYQQGRQYSFVHRTLYAITRPLVTRKDNGDSTVNGALLLGYAASAALTPTFYPSINRNFHDTAATFGGSIGGAALGYFIGEFADDVLQAAHLKRAP